MHILVFGVVVSSLSSAFALISYSYHPYSRLGNYVLLVHLDIMHKLVEQSQILHYTLIIPGYHHVTGQYTI